MLLQVVNNAILVALFKKIHDTLEIMVKNAFAMTKIKMYRLASKEKYPKKEARLWA